MEYLLPKYDNGDFLHTEEECRDIHKRVYPGLSWEQFKKNIQMQPVYQLQGMCLLIRKMHEKFGITPDKVDFSPREKEFRIEAMQEELDEYKDSTTKADELDALVDLVVFALGTAERQGMLHVFEEAFTRVMVANMMKELGPNQKRGQFQLDLVKPEGFKPAYLNDLVGEE